MIQMGNKSDSAKVTPDESESYLISKTLSERLQESITLLKKIQELGIDNQDPSYKELSKEFSIWVKTGTHWEGTINFYRYGRNAEVVLPSEKKRVATCNLLLYKD